MKKSMAPVDLEIRTTDFALRIIRLFAALPKTTEAQVLGKQLLRCGTSVGAHYREAKRGKSTLTSSARSKVRCKNWMKPVIGFS